ncbi:Ribosomal protein S35 mitochondrial [Penicillium cf. griseofulvum]|uniref:Ribosomal protein S35 mitochondrial n=1 Tax=Penicillium cf. griseofulvum TaxID=2972120 RepID=A0A9W9JMA9_9EURO|nr:Ribosomal protein S35 mitochondrial [Penicillium cf. griseofulvum]KAJ5443331.1 Ribosomal protein S35 mitochondrial [Penicillium cf. griseofulvum]
MPPRIQSRSVSNTLLPYLTASSSSSSLSSLPSLSSTSSQCLSRQFSATAASQGQTKLRRQMFEWLNNEGSVFKHHIPGEPNYITRLKGDGGEKTRPFPDNRNFFSEPILSEELRNEVYNRVVEQKKSVRVVSVDLGIDMKRIAAVVRLVELEKRQRTQGKPLALPYARAIHEMVPTTPLAEPGERQTYHEPINDLPAHPLTGSQIFYPVPESRSFNRVEAGRVFSGAPAMEHSEAAEISHPSDLSEKILEDPNSIGWVGKGDNARQILQPADVRIPHPHLVALERDRLAHPNERLAVADLQSKRLERQDAIEQARRERIQARREKKLTVVSPEDSRFDYRIKDTIYTKETTGIDGRGSKAAGRRYGVPHRDRTRGEVKIPTRVEA